MARNKSQTRELVLAYSPLYSSNPGHHLPLTLLVVAANIYLDHGRILGSYARTLYGLKLRIPQPDACRQGPTCGMARQGIAPARCLRRVLLDIALLVGVASFLLSRCVFDIPPWLQARISLRELVSILSFFWLTHIRRPTQARSLPCFESTSAAGCYSNSTSLIHPGLVSHSRQISRRSHLPHALSGLSSALCA
jgi:hypothetical protein